MAEIQKIIRSVDSDGKEILSNILDEFTGENVLYKETKHFADGSLMGDDKVDGVLYIKNTGKYFKRIIDKVANAKWWGLRGRADYVDSKGVFYEDAERTIPAQDSKNILVQAIKDTAAIKIPLFIESGNYMVDVENGQGIRMASNAHLIMEADTVLKQKGTWRIAYSILSINNMENIIIDGGKIEGGKEYHFIENGSSEIWKLWKPNTEYLTNEYVYWRGVGYKVSEGGVSGTTPPTHKTGTVVNGTASLLFYKEGLGEGGHGIFIGNQIIPTDDGAVRSNNILIKNIEVSNMWGDGCAITAFRSQENEAYSDYSTNVTFENVNFHNNRRQGISIISAKGVRIYNSKFNDTIGTPPQTGIDIEPNGYNIVEDVIIRDCEFKNNQERGFIAISNNITGIVRNIKVLNSNFENNIGQNALLGGSVGVSNIEFNGNNINAEKSSGGISVSTSNMVSVINTVINSGIGANYAMIITDNVGVNNCTIDNVKIESEKNGFFCAAKVLNLTLSNILINAKQGGLQFGLQPYERRNVNISNCKVSSNDRSFDMYNIDNLTLKNCEVIEAGYEGVRVQLCRNVVIDSVNVTDAGNRRMGVDACIRVEKSYNLSVLNCTGVKGDKNLNKAFYGLYIFDSDTIKGTIKGNNFEDFSSNGIVVNGELFEVDDISIKKIGMTSRRPSIIGKLIPVGFQYFDTELDDMYVVKGKHETVLIVIGAVPTASGDIKIILDGVSFDIPVEVGETAAEIGLKIRSMQFKGWQTFPVPGIPPQTIFVKNTAGVCVATTSDSNGTGTGIHVTTKVSGEDKYWDKLVNIPEPEVPEA